jgi:flavin-dependent dehydrogenase
MVDKKLKKQYQTIIIGAGPSGLMVGQYLDEAIILEQKEKVGRPMQCIGISKKAFEMQGIEIDSSWAITKSYKIDRVMPNGKVVGKSYEEPIGYVVKKTPFDNFLLNNLKAEIRFNTKVVDIQRKDELWKITTNNDEVLECKYLIGADGFNSIVLDKVFPENKDKVHNIRGLEYSIKVGGKIDIKTIKMYFDNIEYPNGYAWIFPTSKNTANVGIDGDAKLHERLNEFLEDVIKKEYGDYEILEEEGGAVFYKKNGFKLFKENAILIGDAAGLIDPIFRAGTTQAMTSAKIAAKLIIDGKVNQYEPKINSMPFANPKIAKAADAFYSLKNDTLNELGDILENKSFSDIKSLSGIAKVLSKFNIRKDMAKLIKFLTVWGKNKDWLW